MPKKNIKSSPNHIVKHKIALMEVQDTSTTNPEDDYWATSNTIGINWPTMQQAA